MFLYAPTFVDPRGDFPERNIETEFLALTSGIENVKKRLGVERYEAAIKLASDMKPLFL